MSVGRRRAADRSRDAGVRVADGRSAPRRPSADPIGPIDEEDHARHGADRVVAHREGAAACRGVPPVRGPADRRHGGRRPADRHRRAPAARGAGTGRAGGRADRDVGPRARGLVQRERAEGRRGADRGCEPPRPGAGRVRDRQEGRGLLPVPWRGDARRVAGVQRGAAVREGRGGRPHADRRLRRRLDRRAALRVHRLPFGVHVARDLAAVPADRARGGPRDRDSRRFPPSTSSSRSRRSSCTRSCRSTSSPRCTRRSSNRRRRRTPHADAR